MHPTPDQALADRLATVAGFVDGHTPRALSLVIVVQRWHAPTLIQVLREVLHGITPEQTLGWCARLTRTLVRIGPATASRHGENAACVPGVIGACLVADDKVEHFVRPLPPFQGRSAKSGLDGLVVEADAAGGPHPRRHLWLEMTDDDLARSIVDIGHVLAESVLLMGDPIDATLTVSGGPLPDAQGERVIYRRALMPQGHSAGVYRAIMWASE